MGSWTDYFFIAEDIDIIRFFVWHLTYFAVFTGSWIPIWRQSETVEPFKEGKRIKRRLIKYGYQSRKRKEKELKLWSRWVLMNPDYFYNSILWNFIVLFAAMGCYNAHKEGDQGDVRSVALWMASLQATIFGMWTIAPFYWDMPGWRVVHLGVASTMSVAVSWMFAYLDWNAFWAYSVFTVAQIILTTIYGMAFVGTLTAKGSGRTDGRPFEVGNPLRALFMEDGLSPKSYLYRDLHLPAVTKDM